MIRLARCPVHEYLMMDHMRFILTLAIVIGCATFQLGQDKNRTPRRIVADNRNIETSYDRIKKLTTVSLIPMQVYGEPLSSSHYIGSDQASFGASFTHLGRTLRAQPKRVLFSLTSTSQDWKYSDFRKLTAFVDGRRLNLGPMEHVPSFTVNASANTNSDDYISQAIAISVPYKTFVRIASGKKVQIRMGPREFVLTKNHLEALRDLAGRMVPLSAPGYDRTKYIDR